MPAPLAGVLAAMVTPLTPDGRRLDTDAVGPYVRWLADRGVDGIFVGGSTGEFVLLAADERRALLEAVLPAARAAGVRVVAHVGGSSTAATVALARHAAMAGVDAIAAITPWYYALHDEAVAAHLAEAANAAPTVPFFAYHLPSAARNRVTPAVIEALAARCPNLAGVKDSGGDLAAMAALAAAGRAACAAGFTVFCGDDRLALRALDGGVADGIVSGTASSVPEPLVAVWRTRGGQDLVDRAALACGSGGDLGLFKAILALRGVPVGAPRPPLPARTREAALAALRAAGMQDSKGPAAE